MNLCVYIRLEVLLRYLRCYCRIFVGCFRKGSIGMDGVEIELHCHCFCKECQQFYYPCFERIYAVGNKHSEGKVSFLSKGSKTFLRTP